MNNKSGPFCWEFQLNEAVIMFIPAIPWCGQFFVWLMYHGSKFCYHTCIWKLNICPTGFMLTTNASWSPDLKCHHMTSTGAYVHTVHVHVYVDTQHLKLVVNDLRSEQIQCYKIIKPDCTHRSTSNIWLTCTCYCNF